MKTGWRFIFCVMIVAVLVDLVACHKDVYHFDAQVDAGTYYCQKHYRVTRDSVLPDHNSIELSNIDTIIGMDTVRVTAYDSALQLLGFTVTIYDDGKYTRVYAAAGIQQPLALFNNGQDSMEFSYTDTLRTSDTLKVSYRYKGHKIL